MLKLKNFKIDNIMKTKYLFFIVVMVFCFGNSFSQQNQTDLDAQRITIYTDYTIALQDANRMQYLPVIEDTIKVEPEFNYSIQPIVYQTRYTPTMINAASLREEPLPILDNGLIKLGVGNYLSPYIEVFYNNTYERDFSVGAYAKHHSTHGKARNAAGQQIYTGFNKNDFLVYGKRFLKNSTLSGDIGFNSNEIYYYGYDPDAQMIDNPRDKEELEMQRWMNLNPKVRFNSNNIFDKKFNYDLLLDYSYLFNVTDDYHHTAKIGGDFSIASNNNKYGLESKFIYHNGFVDSIEDEDKYLILNPYYKNYSDAWQIKLGVNTTGDFFKADSVNYHFYPNILIQHNVSNVIIPYVSFKGHLEDNCLNSIRKINPYIQRLPHIEATNYAQVLDIGVKGNISRKAYFHINGNYSKIDNKVFFVNDTSEMPLNNKFILEYTNIERFSGYGEISLRNIIPDFNFILKGNYYYYSYVKNKEKPWHMPELDISFSVEYQYTDDITFGSDIFFIGKRYAKEYDKDLNIIERELDPIIDINLYANYTLASNFSCFLYLNNLLGQKQYVWNHYHSLGFNLLLGLKYSF